jgi:GTP-binding protein
VENCTSRILIEEMRREGIEALRLASRGHHAPRRKQCRSRADGDTFASTCPTSYQGIVIEKLARRKGELTNDAQHRHRRDRAWSSEVPTRGLIGYRNEFLTDTRGLGIMSARFTGYGPWCGEVVSRSRGSMISNGNRRRHELLTRKPSDSRTAFRGPYGDASMRA